MYYSMYYSMDYGMHSIHNSMYYIRKRRVRLLTLEK